METNYSAVHARSWNALTSFCAFVVTRRREMEEEIDKNERERISTARPGEEARLQATVIAGHCRMGSLMSQVRKT